MRRFAAAAAIAAAMSVVSGMKASAQATRCGDTHIVAPGDTLATIARERYGSPFRFREIHDANRAQIGPDPNAIEIGQALRIPCLDGAGAARAAADPAAPEPSAAGAGRRGARPDLILAVGGRAAASGGGLFADLVRAALRRAAPDLDYEIAVLADRPARLEDLRGGDGYDLGFPWIRPDCGNAARLSQAMRGRCARYAYSDPFFEVRIGFFTGRRSDYRTASSAEELFGARICRPRDLFVDDLEAVGLVEPNVSMVLPEELDYCLRALRVGEVDVVTAEADRVNEALARLGRTRALVELEPLSGPRLLRIAGPRGLRKTRSAIAALNAGLRELRETGEWFEIVSRHAAATTPTN